MNRTVRDVGGLILAIILMISLYGIYKGDTTATGNSVFDHMTRDVGKAFGNVTIPARSWNLGQKSLRNPETYNRLFGGIPKNAWKKGVTIQGYKGQKFGIKDNGNGNYTLNYNGQKEQTTAKDLQQDGGLAGTFGDDISYLSKMKNGQTEMQDPNAVDHTDQVEDPHNAQYNPNTRTMKIGDFY